MGEAKNEGMTMEQRNIVTQTMTNMYNIYNDIGRIIQVIEEETKTITLLRSVVMQT